MTKKTDFKTKKKAQLEATAAEYESEITEFLRPHDPSRTMDDQKSEVIEWMKTQFLATAKAREILEDFEAGKENTGERN